MTTPAQTNLTEPGTAVSEDSFFTQVLQGLGIKPTQQNLMALADVAHYEGTNNRFNPLNAVIPEQGSTSFNSVGVQSYANEQTGIQGTIDLLSGSHWDAVRAQLGSGNESSILQSFDAAYTWSPGTHIPVLSPIANAIQLSTATGPLSGATATAPGTNISESDALSGTPNITGDIKSVLSWLAAPLENAGFVIGGVIVIIVGLVLLAHVSGADVKSAAANAFSGGGPSDDDSGDDEPEYTGEHRNGGSRYEGRHGEEASAADDAELAAV